MVVVVVVGGGGGKSNIAGGRVFAQIAVLRDANGSRKLSVLFFGACYRFFVCSG